MLSKTGLSMRALVGASVMVGVAHGAAFVNGGFELGPDPGSYATKGAGNTSITGWTVTGHSIDYIGTLWQHGEGIRSLDLNGGGQGGIQQTFDTVLNQVYAVTFLMAGNPDGPPAVKTLTAAAGSFSGNFTATAGTRVAMGWTIKSFNFTAQGASTTLSFASQDAGVYGAALDGVTLAPVPEPFTLLLAGGALAMGVRRRARRA